MIKLTFLGTGTSQGVPLIGCKCRVCISNDPRDKRLRTSVMIETGDITGGHAAKRFVIDTGPDFRQQMLREKVSSLDAVLFTHEHKDHIAGLDEVRAFNFIQQKVMPVYASERVQDAIRREFSYIFETPQYPGIPKIEMITIVNEPFSAEGIAFMPVEVMHHQLPVFGFRVGGLVYITDANFIPETEMAKLTGCDVLVLNALRHEKHISHFTLAQAIETARKIGARQTYFTHISHQMGKHAELEKELPQGMQFAFDQLKVEC